jgi:hypothetical protein
VENNPNSKGIAVTQDEIIEMAIQGHASTRDAIRWAMNQEREVVANWIMDRGFATGHGDSIVDLLDQLQWQIEEKEREACAKIADNFAMTSQYKTQRNLAEWCASSIRARGQA